MKYINKLLLITQMFIGFAAYGNEIRLESLSDLNFVKVGYGQLEIGKAVSGQPFQMAGKTYERGIGVHAPSTALFDLDGKVDKFYALVGVNEIGKNERGSVEFFVYGDGKVIFKSGLMEGGEKPKVIDITLSGIKKLMLKVTDGGDGINSDHANWVNALFTYRGSVPLLIPPTEAVISTPLQPDNNELYPRAEKLEISRGSTVYTIDPVKGDDSNPIGKTWKSFARINAMKLAPGDNIIIFPGTHDLTFKPSGRGTAEKPIVVRFLPGVHTIKNIRTLKLPMFVSNSCDSSAPKPIGIYIQNMKNLQVRGGGVEGADKTMIIFDGRMVQIFNDCSENITFTGLVFDLKRPTVSEFRVLETGPTLAVIKVAEGSDYDVEDNKFVWKGDWGPGNFTQEAIVEEGRCWRSNTPRGWTGKGQDIAKAIDLGDRKVRLEYENGESDLKAGHQYHFRNTDRTSVGVHNARSKDITFRDCDFYALTGMGFVSQFSENITFQRVNVAPPRGTLRTCAAWADVFQFSNCRGNLLVDSCRLSGMQDDAINCHGTYLRIAGKPAENQLLLRFIHPQTYGFAPYVTGDVMVVMNPDTLREYEGNPRAKVSSVEKKSDKDWLVTIEGPMPRFVKDDIVDNLTWNPNITITNNHLTMNPARGFLLSSRGKIIVENNTLQCEMQGILVEGDGKGWMESSPVRDLLINKNRFIKCSISIEANINIKSPEAPVHENIRITNNTFENINGAAVYAKATKGLKVSGNKSDNGAIITNADASCSDVQLDH